MKLYRADKRDFYVGEVIRSANDFFEKNPDGSKEIEYLFESVRPEKKPNRIGCLFLFENEVAAKKHWSKMTDGNLYEVEVDDYSVLHRADMRLVDKAFSSTNKEQIENCAKEYWNGVETEQPRVEILVKEATVTAIISKDQTERKYYLLNWPPA
jgi:hypothetical protein